MKAPFVDSSTLLSSTVEQLNSAGGAMEFITDIDSIEEENENTGTQDRGRRLYRERRVSGPWIEKYFSKTHKIIFCRLCEKQEFKFQFQKMESKWVETRERKISKDWAREPHSSSEDSWLSPWSGQEENQSHSTREKKSSFWITQQENNQSDQLWRDQEKDWLWEPDAP